MSAQSELVGIGLYSLPEASALTGISSAAISRWVFGYTSKQGGQTVHHPPIWTSQIQGYDHKALGFLDLLEVRFVAVFKRYGVSLQAIRAASLFAREYFASDHPFTFREFKTDGRSIFAEVIKQKEFGGEKALIDLVKRQYAFKEVVGPSLYRGIKYDVKGEALSWRPNNSRYVVLDPKRAFGRPIDRTSGVPTEVLFSAYQAEEDEKVVARLYETGVAAVKAAIEFEQGLQQREILH